MPCGLSRDLIVSPNGLGWLSIKPANDRAAVCEILQSQITDGSFTLSAALPRSLPLFVIGLPRRSSITLLLTRVLASMESDTSCYTCLEDELVAASHAVPFSMPTGVGTGGFKATGSAADFLKRLHVIMGHASRLSSMLLTVKALYPEWAGKITKETVVAIT